MPRGPGGSDCARQAAQQVGQRHRRIAFALGEERETSGEFGDALAAEGQQGESADGTGRDLRPVQQCAGVEGEQRAIETGKAPITYELRLPGPDRDRNRAGGCQQGQGGGAA